MKISDEVRSLARRAGVRRQRPVVSVIAVRFDHDGVPRVLLQRRQKLFDDTPFKGYWELPQGRVDKHETITSAANRELQEETGLTIDKFLRGGETPYPYGNLRTSALTYAEPLICVVDAKANFFAMCVVVKTVGDAQQTPEARNHSWTELGEIRTMIDAKRVFPLNVPMLEKFLTADHRRMDA